ncbi:hypothetical protein EN851_03440 [Mesorhizobium sp. M8A.F.Ca.ET.208.01.1.1]|uniref:hypothetical protein n=1 Tax=unclassified Mesorhizobium TaxID=325217 RepID=UPI0010936367|nr:MULTISPECIES: hypothetical protein [unclassified Mesorhizobium]TGQ94622.1 hypothetical protein EN851_03440 [Mesorhizobium sp. M8A.F.Ca.ET.208.01.1.1]TGT55110.1 hypothetical protein EN810_03440 [Mesorhizobium sp. M8A.F.Ca.ET.167.01.1.1]
MMLEQEDVYHAMLAALTEHQRQRNEDAPSLGQMMPIAPFDAETFDDERVKVVGVIRNPGMDVLDFVVIKTLEGGEMTPATESSVWPLTKEAA